jgi:hypothetical protein
MKRWALLLFTGFYLFIVSGVTLGGHFCMGHLQNLKVFVAADGKSCCCEDEKSCGCCESKHVHLTEASEHSYTGAPCIDFNSDFFTALPAPSPTLCVESATRVTFIAHPPPEISRPSVHILNQVFRI